MKKLSILAEKLGIKSALKYKSVQIEVVRRSTGEKFIEKIYGEDAMKIIYGSPIVAKLATKILTGKVLSSIYGAYNDSIISKHKIAEFVNLMEIDVSECEKDITEYQSFNEFFARKLHFRARPINQKQGSIVCPSDGRLLVFPKIDDTTLCYLKWAPIRLSDLFNNSPSLVERYKNGSCAVLRLCPSDYHHFHFPVAGKIGVTKTISGLLHSVNPYALEQNIPVYCLNKRTIAELDSNEVGKVLLMEIGAMFVGTIVQTYRPTMSVEKGEEKGFFKFGGSTCVLFFEKDSMHFDEDLIKNSQAGLETLVKMGEQIGSV
ncbi:MAG: archaetidylserine decarboxylase [Bdellovibrionota bacterium]